LAAKGGILILIFFETAMSCLGQAGMGGKDGGSLSILLCKNLSNNECFLFPLVL
jgi:hypothetical protein